MYEDTAVDESSFRVLLMNGEELSLWQVCVIAITMKQNNKKKFNWKHTRTQSNTWKHHKSVNGFKVLIKLDIINSPWYNTFIVKYSK